MIKLASLPNTAAQRVIFAALLSEAAVIWLLIFMYIARFDYFDILITNFIIAGFYLYKNNAKMQQ